MGATNIKEALAYANKQLKPKIDSALSREVYQVVVDVEAFSIDEKVYDTYRPLMYERRGDMGGLADKGNIIMKGGKATNGVLRVINITDPNPGGTLNRDRVTVGKSLPELIEYGNNNRWGYKYNFQSKGAYMNPRPFTEATIRHLRYVGSHVLALQNGLKRQGVKSRITGNSDENLDDLFF